MRVRDLVSPRRIAGVMGVLGLAFGITVVALAREGASRPVAAQPMAALEATIFSYDGTDFTRVQTTLKNQGGTSAIDSKLDHDTPAFAALNAGQSWHGDATIFGKNYQAFYAPLKDADGIITGALFVGVPK